MTGRRLWVSTAVVAVLGIGAVAAWVGLRPGGGLGSLFVSLLKTGDTSRSRVVEPPSPYRNTRPGVNYLGDDACAACHREIARTYRDHPMGQSLGLAGDDSPGRPIIPTGGVAFEANGFHYSVERRGGAIVHKESRRAGSGRVVSEVEAQVLYALGSGSRGVAYLFERDGYLFQSPISWYAQERRWDLAPGYGRDNPHFGRTIEPACLFCHANRVEPVAGSEYRYRPPTFHGHAIGCERCHGPGELHVKDPGRSGGFDPTIVNPAELDPVLRDSVCQQCHLLGAGRLVRGGHETFDYRPGLPLRRFWAVYRPTAPPGGGDFRSVGHVEQMEASSCARASGGRLGCISCHDPHRLPAESEKAAYYRGRCLACHERKGCSSPPASRRARGDDCVACHMPRLTLNNVAHTAATDHRIPRIPAPPAAAPTPAPPPRPGESPLVDYFAPQMTARETRDAERDLGMAVILVGKTMASMPGTTRAAGAMALPLLRTAAPDDWAAREAEGTALRFLGRPDEALAVLRSVDACAPGRETVLRSIATATAEAGQFGPSRAAWGRVLEVDPWHADDHRALAAVCAALGDWTAAAASCREALRLNPASVETRSFLVRALLRSGDPARARAEFDDLVALTPAGRVVWEDWFRAERAQAPSGPGG